MFTSKVTPATPQYADLPLPSVLSGDHHVSSIKETDPAKLNHLIDEELAAGKLDQASLCAEKLAVFYGVPGLVKYVDVILAAMRELKAEGDSVEQMGFEALEYLILAQRIYEVDARALKFVKDIMPSEAPLSADYWQVKKELIYELVDIRFLENDAKKTADEFIKILQSEDVISPRRPSTPV